MIQTERSFDIPTDELIDIRKGQIATLLFRNPNESYVVREPQLIGITKGGKIIEERIEEKEVGRLSPRETHRLQAHGLFQMWSSLVYLYEEPHARDETGELPAIPEVHKRAVDMANWYTFGIEPQRLLEGGVIYKKGDEDCNGK